MEKLIENLEKYKHVTRFVSLTYRAKGTGEVARHTVLVGAYYLRRVEATLLAVDLLIADGLSEPELTGALEVKKSLENTLTNAKEGLENSAYTKTGMYRQIFPGLALNVEKGTLEIRGFVQSKIVLEPGIYKKVNSSETTLAKKAIRKKVGFDNYRSFSVDATLSTHLNGETIELG